MENPNEILSFLYLLVLILSALHVYRDCKRIGEPAFFNVTGTIILWPFFYLIGWLWIWPGSLKKMLFGESIDDLAQAKAYVRVQEKRNVERNQRR